MKKFDRYQIIVDGEYMTLSEIKDLDVALRALCNAMETIDKLETAIVSTGKILDDYNWSEIKLPRKRK